jgi:prepilin-type N-terminal cleavage/methylation domain-containing protein
MSHKQSGFTLIEIAIVLVIIGLLLGGLLKGQELITNARVRNIISQQDGIKAAYFAFQDRYRGIPGDYPQAQAAANIPGIAALNGGAGVGGNGDGVVANTATATESVLAWVHLSHAGLITGSYTAANNLPTAGTDNSPTNPYGALMQIHFDNVYQGALGNRTNLKTGNQIPVEIMAEIDRKIDDSRPQSGDFRFSVFNGGTTAPSAATCMNGAATEWNAVGGEANCGAASLF